MKTFLATLLCLCMLLPCVMAESTAAEAWLEEKSLALASVTNEAIHSETYYSLMLGGNTLKMMDDLRQTDYSSPVSVQIHTQSLPAIDAYTIMMESVLAETGFSAELNKAVLDRMNASLPSLLISAEGTDMLAASSVFTFSDAWPCPDDIAGNAHVFLEYEGNYVLWVSFHVSGLGTVSGQTHLLSKTAYEEMNTTILQLLSGAFQ